MRRASISSRIHDRLGTATTIAMARVVVPIYFDYASTLCYIAWRIVRELEAELNFEALWKGVPIAMRDLRTRPGLVLGDRELGKIANVSAETGIAVTPPRRWLDSEAAIRGAELAREAGAFAAYHNATFRAAFEEGLDIGSLGVLAGIAEIAGMNRDRFCADVESGRMAAKIAEHKAEADRFSALGYPTFILGDFPLIGIQPIDTMRLLLRRFIDQRTAEPQA
jgi:predicted DsbA family dithiol-disulfide isomerase